MKHRWKRLLSGMLAAVMLLTMLPATALAAVSETANMDQAQREAILAELQSITGSEQEAESLYRRMQALGLFDADGNWTTEKLQINGEEYTLAEARSFVDTLTDDTFVTVGETTITAADLRTMIGIEEEIVRIRDTYFSGEEWTDEEKENLASLEQAIRSGDFIVRSDPLPELIGPSGVNHNARVSVSVDKDTFQNSESGTATVTLTLTGAADGQAVTFDYTTLDGSAHADENYTAVTGTSVTLTNDTPATITVTTKESDERWNGDRLFFLQIGNLQNALFENGTDSYLVQFAITNDSYDTTAIGGNLFGAIPPQGSEKYLVSNGTLTIYVENSSGAHQLSKSDLDNGSQYLDPVSLIENLACAPLFLDGAVDFSATLSDSQAENREITKFTIELGGYDSSYWDRYNSLITMDVLNNTYDFAEGRSPVDTDYFSGTYIQSFEIEYTNNSEILQDGILNSIDVTLQFDDFRAPEYRSVSGPAAGVFTPGMIVPVVITFSEPVWGGTAKAVINETELTSAESEDTYSTRQTFLYEVKPLDGTTLSVSEVSGAKDLGDNVMETHSFGSDGIVSGVTLQTSDQMQGKISSIAMDTETYSPLDTSGTLTVHLADLGVDTTKAANFWKNAGLTARLDGETEITLALNEEVTAYTGTVNWGQNTTDAAKSHTIELFYQPSGTDTPQLYFGKAVQFTQSAPVFITEADLLVQTDNFPAAGQPVYTDEDREMTVSVGFADGKTENDFTWGSTALGNAQDGSEDNYTWGVQIKGVDETGKEAWTDAIDGSIASVDMKRIDQNENMSGTIALGGSAGTFRVSLTAKNGGVEGKAVTVYSQAVTVGVGKNPMLTIPASLQTINIKGGDSATLRWTSNLTERNYYKLLDQGKTEEEARAEQFPFTIEVYERKDHNYVYTPEDGSELPPSDLNDSSKWEKVQGPITVNSSMNAPASSYSIAGLDAVSIKGGYSYAIKLSAKFNETGDNITEYPSYALVSVVSRPAVVTLQRPDTLYYTESSGVGGVDLNWSLQNFDDVNNGTFELIVTNNDSGVSTTSTKTSATGGSYHLKFDALSSGRMRESYTVEVRVRNTPESTWSYDSVVLYHYDDDAFQIYVNGTQADGSLVMDNANNPVDGAAKSISQMTQDDILALNRDIALADTITLNPKVPWSNVSDQVEWSSSNNSTATINYRQGTLYEDIRLFNYETYSPGTVFMLSGLTNGTTEITAQHRLADVLNDKLSVQVNTLKDKLYLFQFAPGGTVELKYTNGAGQTVTRTSNASGAAAIYEPSGIASAVTCKAVIEDTTYVGTFPAGTLVSGEGDSTKLELYPQNNMELGEVAKAKLFLKDEQGRPYANQEVALKAGVYRNDEYCDNAKFSLHSGEQVDQPGNAFLTGKTDADGALTIYMDASQFYAGSNQTVLQSDDKLEFIFEIHPGGADATQYYPQLLKMDGMASQSQTVQFGESIINLRKNSDDTKHPYVVSQMADFGEQGTADLLDASGKVGPNDLSKEVTIQTEVLWWGTEDTDTQNRKIRYYDTNANIEAPGQTSEQTTYEFTDLVLTENTLTLNEANMKNWIDPMRSRGMELRYYGEDGTLSRTEAQKFRVINLLGVDLPGEGGAADQNINKLMQSLTSDYLTGIVGGDSMGVGTGDALLGAGFSLLGNTGINLGDTLNLNMFSTGDPTVFHGLISVGYGSLTGAIENETGTDYEYKDILKNMYSQQARQETMSDLDSALSQFKSGGSKGGFDPSFEFKGFLESEIFFDEDAGKWTIFVLNGGFTAGLGVDYTWKVNSWLGPIPVTAELGAGGGVALDFNVGVDRQEDVNYYLTELRLVAYMRAFGGLGFDFSIIALRIGMFGEVDLKFQARWLNVDGSGEKLYNNMNGQHLTVKGQAGIEFYTKFIFISYRAILASVPFTLADESYKQWDQIDNAWEQVGQGISAVEGGIIAPSAQAASNMVYYNDRTGETLYMSPTIATVETRDYLENGASKWNPLKISLFSLDDSDDTLDTALSNAYPGIAPVLSEDGALMGYLSDEDSEDITATRAAVSFLKDGKYQKGNPINGEENTGYGDSQLDLAGTSSFAVAAWTRQTQDIGLEAGDAISETQQAAMMNAADIMVSVYNGGKWSTTQVTSDNVPDLAPAVATNSKQAIVAWRSVASTNTDQLTRFDSEDSILYKTYDGEKWSDTKTLYNGTSGAVKGLEAAMLDNGTAAIVYSIDTNDRPVAQTVTDQQVAPLTDEEAMDHSGMEVLYAIVPADTADTQDNGQTAEAAVSTVRLTSDNVLDENPQVTTANIGDKEHFIIGWSRTEANDEGTSETDLSLRAVGEDGKIRSDVPDGISEMTQMDDVRVTTNFRFAKGANNFNDLSVLWVEPLTTSEEKNGEVLTTDKDRLMGIRFVNSNGSYGITAPLEVAVMGERTAIDYFDSYAQNDGHGNVRAVILGTTYGESNQPAQGADGKQLTVTDADGKEQPVYIAESESKLYTATGSYENTVSIDSISYDQSSVISGFSLPVQVKVTNRGIDPITNIKVSIGTESNPYDTGSTVTLTPGQSITLNVPYTVPAPIADADCTVTASFGDSGNTATATESLALALPDVGISRIDLLEQTGGHRALQVALYNDSDVALDSGKYQVKVGLYSDPEGEHPLVDPISVDSNDYTLINEGGYTCRFDFDVAKYVRDTLKESEIPDGGIQLYAKAWLEPVKEDLISRALRAVNLSESTTGEAVLDAQPGNDAANTIVYSLSEQQDGEPVTVTAEMDNSGGVSKVTVTVQNNTLSTSSNGNLIVYLLDENGNVIETQQLYKNSQTDLIVLNGAETSATKEFTFTQVGADVHVLYSPMILDDSTNSAELSALTAVGLPVKLSDFDESGKAEVAASGLTSVDITAVAASPDAKVSINGQEQLYQNTQTIPVSANGNTVITIVVTNGSQTKTYELTIRNTTEGTGGGGGGSTTAPEYSVTTPTGVENGTVSVSPEKAQKGETVTIITTPDEGYTVGEISVKDKNGQTIPLTSAGNGKYTFVMPDSPVTISVSFVEGSEFPFSDVPENAWFRDAVQYMLDNEMMNGVTATTFGPNTTTTRGMIVTILYRLEGEPDAAASSFTDVASNMYYADAINWAAANGIVNGVSEISFAPDNQITREQMAAILYRYAQFKGYDVTASNDLSSYTDASQISEYATTAMQWANAEELITGRTSTTLAPQGTATRAEVATILMRFCENIAG